MLPRLLKEIQLDSGLNTKGDKRAQPEQLLDIATNVEFDDVGGLRVRFPFDNVRSSLVGGGTLSNPRRLAMHGDELLCFTDTTLYAWIPSASAWASRGDHLAVATDEQTVFAAPGDQTCGDRAELAGQIVYCWQTEVGTGGGASATIWVAVVDKASGAVVQPPTVVATTVSPGSPRLVALASCVMLLYAGANNASIAAVFVTKITLAPFTITVQPNAGAGFISTPFVSIGLVFFDVCKIPGQDRFYVAAAQTPTIIGYVLADCDSNWNGAAFTSSTTSGGPLTIAVDPAASKVVLVTTPHTSTNVVAYSHNVTAAAVPVTLAATTTIGTYGTGTALQQITAAFRLTQDGGQYRCYAFWSLDEVDDLVFESRSNWIDTSAAIGTAAPFVYALGIGAHAFAHDSHVYLIGTFAGLSFSLTDPTGTHSELQNTYYLYRDDAFLVAKAVWGEGAGLSPKGCLSTAIADSANANAIVWMGGVRRIDPVGSNALNPVTGVEAYAERAPREVTWTFDDDRARRCVQFGSTLYITGGIVLQYDGVELTEVGFCTYPWIVDAATGTPGVIDAGGYSYKATDRWTNGKGETDRSTTATVTNITLATPISVDVVFPNLYVTRKKNVALEVWRTEVNPVDGGPFFLATGTDPAVLSGNNPYIVSDPTSINLALLVDNMVDATLAEQAANPENGAVLANIEPPPASIIYADAERIYLAGIPGAPNTVYYSKYRQPGSVASFNDGLSFDVPIDGGAITAIDALDGALIVWCESATYQYAGAGLDDTGGGGNFQLARILRTEIGAVSQEAVAFFDDGWLVKTGKGWFVLDRSLSYHYVGAGWFKYDAEPVLSMIVLTARHQVRVLTSARMLVFDTLVSQWAETSVNDGVDMALWNGAPAYLAPTGVRAELATWDGYSGDDYTLVVADVEPSWIKFGNALQARAIADFVQLLGEFRSPCLVRARLAKDYEAVSPGVWNYHTDKVWTPAPAIAGSSLQVRQSPRWKRCEALKARFTITNADGVSPLAGPCARLTAITIPFAVEPNAYSALSAAQKQ